MMNKFLNYQKLLARSLKPGETYDDSNHPFTKFSLVIFFIYLIVSIKGTGQFIFIILGYCLVYIYYIINSSNKLYEIPPVSKLYTVVNIYLYFLLTIIICYILGFGVNIITLLSFGEKYLFLDFITSWKGVILSLLLSIFISCIYIPAFFIKPLAIRRVLILLETIFFKILLIALNNSIGNSNEMSFLKRISTLGNYNIILIILMLFLIIIAPVSIAISYRLYRRKEIL
jgi:hypothetical protein